MPEPNVELGNQTYAIGMFESQWTSPRRSTAFPAYFTPNTALKLFREKNHRSKVLSDELGTTKDDNVTAVGL
jgi:hypothetical protein